MRIFSHRSALKREHATGTNLIRLSCVFFPLLPHYASRCNPSNAGHIVDPPQLAKTISTVNSHFEMFTVYSTRHNLTQGFSLVPGHGWVAPFNVDAYMGPWGWQWKRGVHRVVSVPPSPAPITTETLMDDIEKVRVSLKARVSSVTDMEFLGCSWHAKNHHGFGLFKVPPMPLHGGRSCNGEPPQPPPQMRK